jgi:hypothetical protein
MPGLVPGIHVLLLFGKKTWMAGTSPAMTNSGAEVYYFTPSNSTSNISVALGGITPPAPRAP